jgi:hypothetical protein
MSPILVAVLLLWASNLYHLTVPWYVWFVVWVMILIRLIEAIKLVIKHMDK